MLGWSQEIGATSAYSMAAMRDEIAQALIQRCPVALSLHTARGEFLGASDECAQLFACDVEALLRGSLWQLVDARDVDRIRLEWGAADLSGADTALRYRLAATGAWIETELRTHPEAVDGARIACASRRVRTAEADTTGAAAATVDSMDIVDAVHSERANLELAARHRDVLVDLLPALVWYGPVTADLKNRQISYVSEYLLKATGYRPEEWFGTPGFWRDRIHPDDLESILAATDQMMRGERTQGPPYRMRTSGGRWLWLQSSMHIEHHDGTPIRMYGVTLDVTTYVAASERDAQLQRELSDRATRILELSAPVIPLRDDVLLMPLIGAIDPERADHALEVLLAAVQHWRARRVILDLTGVHSVDAHSIASIVRAADAVRMLGARVALTGLQPEVALVIVELGLSLTGLKVYRSLRDALGER